MSFESPLPVPFPPNADVKRQAIAVPGSEGAGHSAIYKSAIFDSPTTMAGLPKTVYEVFNLGLKMGADRPCLGRRPWDAKAGDWAERYEWENYGQVDTRRKNIASGLLKLQQDGVIASSKEMNISVGIWSLNRPEWQHVSQACAAYSLVLTSLYDTLGKEAVQFIIGHAEVSVVFAAPSHIPALLKLAKHCPTLKLIISLDSWSSFGANGQMPTVKSEAVLKDWAEQVGVKLMDLPQVEALGAANPRPHSPPSPADTAMLCYTSGTTGNPKGVVLTHKALSAAVAGNTIGSIIYSDAVLFSYLPLSHIYERFCEDSVFAVGGSIGYSCGDNLRLLEDLKVLKPTIFMGVPRVLNRIYQMLKAQTVDAPGVKGALCRKVFADKLYNLKNYGQVTHAVWDRLILKKVREALGGNIVLISSGSAPLNGEVLDFLKVAFSASFTEGYGMTENAAACTRCWADDPSPGGTVGPPVAGVELMLVDVPEMGYFSTDKPHPRGEICARGEMVCTYYKDPEKSAESVDKDGWLHTGDVGLIDAQGRLKIVDRIKNLIKMSQGEYVAVEKVENVYTLCPLLAQLWITASPLEDNIVGIVVPDPVTFTPFLNRTLGASIKDTDLKQLQEKANDPKVIKALAAELAKFGQQAGLNGFERLNENFHITLEPFTVENDMLTPTFKVKRNVATKHYEKILKQLYARGAGKKVAAKM